MIVWILLLLSVLINIYLWHSKWLAEKKAMIPLFQGNFDQYKQQHENLVQAIIDAIPYPLFYKDLDFRMLGANQAYKTAFGVSNKDLYGKHIMDLEYVSIDERKKFFLEDQSLAGTASSFSQQKSIAFADGKIHHTLYCKKGFMDPAGKPAGLIGVFVDLSELIEAQASALQARQDLERELLKQKVIVHDRERYYAAFQKMIQPIIISDPSGVILQINDAFSSLYGYSQEEAAGNNPSILNPGLEEYINLGFTEDEYHDLFRSMWDDIKDPAKSGWEGVVINKKKDGTLVWIHLKISAILDLDGHVISLIGLPLDITENKKREDLDRVQLFRTIAGLAELRDNETGNHMRRVGIFSRLLAKACGYGKKYCEDIEIFAPLHDIGKVGILDSLLSAPRKLTQDEFEVMKTHTQLGYNIVKDKPGCEMAAEIILHHHEKYDGTGYPGGVTGEAIPMSAQIVAVADVYDALRSQRPYKQPFDHAAALRLLEKEKGTHFSPGVIERFFSIEKEVCRVYGNLQD